MENKCLWTRWLGWAATGEARRGSMQFVIVVRGDNSRFLTGVVMKTIVGPRAACVCRKKVIVVIM